MAALTNREILFKIRMRNEAKAALQSLGVDFRKIAKEAGTLAAAQRAAAKELDATGRAAGKTEGELTKLLRVMTQMGKGGGGSGLNKIGTEFRRGSKEAGTYAAALRAVVTELDRVEGSALKALAAIRKLSTARAPNISPGAPGAPGGGGGGRPSPRTPGGRGEGGHGPNIIETAGESIRHLLGFATFYTSMELLHKGAEKFVDASTEYSNLVGKIELATKPGNAEGVRDRLFQVARDSHQDIESVGEAFYKGKGALGKFGFSDNDIINLSKVVNQANLISHASPQAAKYGTYELFQGIGAGKLNGRELRFIAQDSIRLATALSDGLAKVAPQIAKKFGSQILSGPNKGGYALTPGQFPALAKSGVLTGPLVARALLTQQDALSKQVNTIPLTLPRVKNDLNNSFTKSFGDFDKKNGISEGLLKSLETLADAVIPNLISSLQPVADLFKDVFTIGKQAGDVLGSLFGGLGISVKDITGFVLTFVAAFAGLAGIAAVVAGIGAAFAFIAGIIGGPITLAIAVVAGLAAVFELNRDKVVSFGGTFARVSDYVGAYWDALCKLLSTAWADFMISVVNPLIASAKFIFGFGKSILDFFLNLTASIGGLVVDAVSNSIKAIGKLIEFAGKGLNLVHQGAGDGLIDFAGGVDKFADGFNKSAKTVLKYTNIVNAAVGASRLAGQVIGGAFKGVNEEAARRTKNAKPKKDHVVGLGNLDDATRELGDPAEAGKKEKKGRKGPDLVKEAADAIRALTTTYAPFLAAQVKDTQDADKLNDIRKLQATNTAKFNEALKKSGLTLAQFNELAYGVKSGLTDTSVKDFFTAYVVGFKDMSDADKKTAANNQTAVDLIKARTDAYTKGGAALAYYTDLLKQFHVTDSDVQQGQLFQSLGLDATQLSTDKLDAFLKSALTAKEQIKYKLSDTTTDDKDQGTAKATRLLLGLSPAQLDTLPAQLKSKISALRQAVTNSDNGISEKSLSDQRSRITDVIGAYSPYLEKQIKEGEELTRLNKLQSDLVGRSPDLIRALNEMEISTDTFAAKLAIAHDALANQSDVFAQFKVAANDYAENIKAHGTTIRSTFTNAFKGIEDSLLSFVQTGKLNFADLTRSILADLERIAIEKAIVFALNFIPGIGPAASSVASAAFGAHHAGGIAGGHTAWSRSLSPSVFAGAQRYHTGGLVGNSLKGGEVPIIAKKNEAVLPTVRLPDGNFGVRSILPDAGSTASRGGGNTIHFMPQLNITVQGGGDDPKGHGEAVSKSLLPALRQMVQDQIIDQLRPGGLLTAR